MKDWQLRNLNNQRNNLPTKQNQKSAKMRGFIKVLLIIFLFLLNRSQIWKRATKDLESQDVVTLIFLFSVFWKLYACLIKSTFIGVALTIHMFIERFFVKRNEG